MPIYEYRCQQCGHELETMQRITADPLKTCPVCQENALQRLISQTSFILKGSGWYVTDYGGKKNGTGKPSDETSSSASATESPAKASESSSGSDKSGTSKKPQSGADSKAAA